MICHCHAWLGHPRTGMIWGQPLLPLWGCWGVGPARACQRSLRNCVCVGVSLNLGGCREGVAASCMFGQPDRWPKLHFPGAAGMHPGFLLGSLRSRVISSALCVLCRLFAVFLSVSFPSVLLREIRGGGTRSQFGPSHIITLPQPFRVNMQFKKFTRVSVSLSLSL